MGSAEVQMWAIFAICFQETGSRLDKRWRWVDLILLVSFQETGSRLDSLQLQDFFFGLYSLSGVGRVADACAQRYPPLLSAGYHSNLKLAIAIAKAIRDLEEGGERAGREGWVSESGGWAGRAGESGGGTGRAREPGGIHRCLSCQACMKVSLGNTDDLGGALAFLGGANFLKYSKWF